MLKSVMKSTVLASLTLGTLVLWGCTHASLGNGKNPNVQQQVGAPLLRVDGDEQISIALKGKGTLRAKYDNVPGADALNSVVCKIDGEAKGSKLDSDGRMKPRGTDALELVVYGGDQEATFKVQCASPSGGGIEYTVLVGIPDLKGTYELQTMVGYRSQLPGAVNLVVDVLACLGRNKPGDCLVNYFWKWTCGGNFFCELIGKVVTFVGLSVAGVDVNSLLEDLVGSDFIEIGKVADLFKKMTAEHRIVTEMSIRPTSNGKFEAKHRFTRAYCNDPGEDDGLFKDLSGTDEYNSLAAVDEGKDWSDISGFEIGFNSGSGEVSLSKHTVDLPYRDIVSGCLDSSIQNAAGAYDNSTRNGQYGDCYDSSDCQTCAAQRDLNHYGPYDHGACKRCRQCQAAVPELGTFEEYIRDSTCGFSGSGWGSNVCKVVVGIVVDYVKQSILGVNDNSLEIDNGSAKPILSGRNSMSVRRFEDGKWKITRPYNADVKFSGRRIGDASEDTSTTGLL